MQELSKKECLELEQRVADKMNSAFSDEITDTNKRLYETLIRLASRATIMTIREYEKMQVENQES